MAAEIASTSRRRTIATDCDMEESGEVEGAKVEEKEEKHERLLEVQGRRGSLRFCDI